MNTAGRLILLPPTQRAACTCLMVPFSKCFFMAFLMRNFFFSISIPGYFVTMYLRTDWYETPALLLHDCNDTRQTC